MHTFYNGHQSYQLPRRATTSKSNTILKTLGEIQTTTVSQLLIEPLLSCKRRDLTISIGDRYPSKERKTRSPCPDVANYSRFFTFARSPRAMRSACAYASARSWHNFESSRPVNEEFEFISVTPAPIHDFFSLSFSFVPQNELIPIRKTEWRVFEIARRVVLKNEIDKLKVYDENRSVKGNNWLCRMSSVKSNGTRILERLSWVD